MLRPFDVRHLTERYVSWLNDPAVVRFSEQRHTHHTLESCKTYADQLLDGKHFFWAIELQSASPEHIGNLTAYRDRPNNVAEIAILLGERKHHGNHYGKEAWCAVVEHLVVTENVRRIEAGAMEVNKPMLRIFEASGMREECRQKGRFLLDGQPIDLIYASRFANGVGC